MLLHKRQWKYQVNFRANSCYFHTYKLNVGFTLEARLVSSKHLEILRRSVETCWQSVLLDVKPVNLSIH